MSSDEKNCEQQSTPLSCSHSCILMTVSEKPGNIKLSSSEPGCYCTKTKTECPKLCQTCTINVTSSNPASFSVELCECEDETLPPAPPPPPPPPAATSEEEETHEHKSRDTPDSIHNAQGIQRSYKDSDACPVSCIGACSSQSSVITQKPVKIDPQLKDHTPKSIEELKASITGLTDLEKSSVGNPLGCEYFEFHCEIRSLGVCEPEDSQTSEPSCSDRPVRQGFSLTMEPNDHRFCTNPDDCKHTRESSELAPCPPVPCPSEEPPCPPKEPPCPPKEPRCTPKEPPCPLKEPPCPPEESPCPPEEPPCSPEEPPTPPRLPCDSSDCEQCAFERLNKPPC